MPNSFYFSSWPFHVDLVFDHLHSTLTLLENSLENESRELSERYKRGLETVPHDRLNDFSEHFGDLAWQLDEMESVTRISIFFFCYARLEHELNEFCRMLRLQKMVLLNLVDIQGRGIVRAKKFLEKVLKVEVSNNEIWKELISYNELRNDLIHNGISVKKENIKKFRKSFNDNSYIKISDFGVIHLEKEFSFHVIEKFRTFLFECNSLFK